MDNFTKNLHLYRRAGFGVPLSKLDLLEQSPDKNLNAIFKSAKNVKPLPRPDYNMPKPTDILEFDAEEKQKFRMELRKLVAEVSKIWLEKMASGNNPFLEKMALFWHGHFACESKAFHFAMKQINTIREHALGNFRDLVKAMAKDAAMILYLNNQQNRKKKPNENFARELMELFTIGRGNYTENDIKEAARAFTGWFANRHFAEFEFNEKQHDFGTKQFMGKSGNFDGNDIIDIILEQKATAEFISAKAYRFFVNDEVNENHVKQIAKKFYESDYDIAEMMRFVFESEWFYDEKNIAAKVKSPIELIVQNMQYLGLKFGNKETATFMQFALGQVLFQPPNVAGWEGGNAWIDNTGLLFRMNLSAFILSDETKKFKNKANSLLKETNGIMDNRSFSYDLKNLAKTFEKYDDTELGKAIRDFLLPIPMAVPIQKLAFYANNFETKKEKTKAWAMALMGMPEFQLA